MKHWAVRYTDEQIQLGKNCYAALAGGSSRLVKAGLNLWTGYEFDVKDGLGTWGDEYFKVFVQAMQLYRGRAVLNIN